MSKQNLTEEAAKGSSLTPSSFAFQLSFYRNSKENRFNRLFYRNTYFLGRFSDPSLPNYLPPPPEASSVDARRLHIMGHVVRTELRTAPPRMVKSIVDADRGVAVYQHFPLK